jgi:hypothetical protein
MRARASGKPEKNTWVGNSAMVDSSSEAVDG